MPNIVAMSGSLRSGSFNAALLRAAVQVAPEGLVVDVGSIRGIPLYDGDEESAHGIPPVVQDLKERIAASDGLLLVTPEYNNGIPGVFKNAIDWLSRPASDIPRVFGDLPVGLMGATPGRAGTILSQTAWLQVFRALGVRPWFGPRMMVSGAGRAFDAEGQLIDEDVRKQLTGFMASFAEHLQQGQ